MIGLRLLAVGVLVLLEMASWSGYAYAQGPCWSTSSRLSIPLSDWGWFPDVAVDGRGGVHVIWQAGQCSTQLDKPCLMYSTRLADGSWSTYDVFVDKGAGQSAIRSATAVSTDNRLHLVYLRDFTAIDYQQVSVEGATGAQAWTKPHQISGLGHAYFPDIAIDSHGNIHAVWTEAAGNPPSSVCPTGDCSDVFYRRSTDGGGKWSPIVNLSRSAVGTMKVHVRIDPSDRIHVFWEEGGDRWVTDQPVGVAYALSLDGGTSWSAPVTFTYANDVPRQITVGIGGKGQILAIWRPMHGDTVFYQISSDGLSWSPPRAIPGFYATKTFGVFDVYDAATDSLGAVHVVAAGRGWASGEQAIFHLEWDGQTWSKPEQVSPYGGYPEFPRLAISEGNKLHVAWYTKQLVGYEEGQEMQVWYSECQTSAPAEASALLPTKVPVATLQPSPTPLPVPTTWPTVVPGNSGIPNADALYTEGDEVTHLLIAVAPLAIITAVVIVVRSGWGRKILGLFNRRDR